MQWKLWNTVLANNSPGTIKIALFVFLVCAAIVVLPVGAANTTQTVSTTQTTVSVTTAATTSIPSTTHTTSPVTTSTTVSTTQTTIPATTKTTVPTTSQTTAVVTTAAQSQVPIAALSGYPTEGPVSLTVQFTDLSTGGPTSWSWDFGDGSTDSTQSPSHTYTVAGTYSVSLTSTTRTGSVSTTRADYIVVDPSSTVSTTETTAETTATTTTTSSSSLLAAFTGSPRTGSAPLTVMFTDTTVGTPLAWQWDFGDSKTDTSQNPIHTYKNAGTYTVTLTVNSSGSGKIIKQTDFITVSVPLESTQTETASTGSSSKDNQVSAKFTPLASSGTSSGQVSTGKTKTPTPTLTGKAWLDYEQQRMAAVDNMSSSQPKNDIISQILGLFKGLFSWI